MKIFFKKFIIIIILLILIFSLTGCYDAKGVEELAYVVAIGIDLSDDNQLELTLQFATSDAGVNTSSSSSNNGSSSSSQTSGTSITTVKCASIDSGLALINGHISKRINLSHSKEIIISEKLAYSGLSDCLDTLTNKIEIRPDCSIVISNCKAQEYLKNVKPSLENLTARYYKASLNSYEYTGYTVNMKLAEFYSSIKDTYSESYAILGGVNTDSLYNSTKLNANYTAGNIPISDKDQIETLGIAVFHGDKLVGELTGLDSICHLIVTNQLKKCTFSIPNPYENDKYIDLTLTCDKKTKCSVSQINSSPLININVYLIGYGLSLDSSISYDSDDSLKDIKLYGEKYIKEQIEHYLYKTAKEYNSDIAGFGKYSIKNYLTIQEWEKANWLENYKNSFFNVNLDLNVKAGSMFSKH